MTEKSTAPGPKISPAAIMSNKLPTPALSPEATSADFLDVLRRLCPILKDQANLTIITNAGGINPAAAARAAVETAHQLGLSGLRIATVLGDDLMPRLDELAGKVALAHLDTGAPFSEFPGSPLFAAAYLGARPIAVLDALRFGDPADARTRHLVDQARAGLRCCVSEIAAG